MYRNIEVEGEESLFTTHGVAALTALALLRTVPAPCPTLPSSCTSLPSRGCIAGGHDLGFTQTPTTIYEDCIPSRVDMKEPCR